MKNTCVAYTSGQSEACLGYDNDSLYISTQEIHTDFEELKNLALAFRRTNTNGYWTIELQSIGEVNFHEKAGAFFIRYQNSQNKRKKFWFHIKDNSIRTSFCTTLALACNLGFRHEKKNRFASLAADLLKVLTAGVFTWGAFYLAQNGSSSRRALVSAIAGLLQSVGPMPVLAIGGTLCCFFIFFLIKHLAQAGKTIQYTTL